MKPYLNTSLLILLLSSTIQPTSFDYSMASSIDTIFKRESEILNSDQALQKLLTVALSFWNSNTKPLVNFIKSDKNSIPQTLQALTFMNEAIDLGQALSKAEILSHFESQYLLAALVLDKITLITNGINDRTDLIKFNQETIIILKAQLTNLLDSLKLVSSTLKQTHLETATNIALQISQPQLNHTKKLYSAIGNIQTIDTYAHFNNNKTMKDNLKQYKCIIDVRDDGNSGYRAFLTSTFMHAIDIHQKDVIHHIKKLINDNFLNLFMKYDQLFPHNIQASIGHAVQKHLMKQLNILEHSKNVEQVQQILNEEVLFDFYMIKFLRYLIIDYVDKNTDIQSMVTLFYTDLETYQKHIVSWGNEITDIEFSILALAMNISISIQNKDSMHQALTLHQATPEFTKSYLVETENPRHYIVVLPKKCNFFSKTAKNL